MTAPFNFRITYHSSVTELKPYSPALEVMTFQMCLCFSTKGRKKERGKREEKQTVKERKRDRERKNATDRANASTLQKHVFDLDFLVCFISSINSVF